MINDKNKKKKKVKVSGNQNNQGGSGGTKGSAGANLTGISTPGSEAYINETNRINNSNGQNTSLGYTERTNNPKNPNDIFAITDPSKERNILTSKPRDRVGVLNPTSYNTPTTSFKTSAIDDSRSKLSLKTPNNEYQGTVSRNVANKLGRGTGSFSTMDPGVSMSNQGSPTLERENAIANSQLQAFNNNRARILNGPQGISGGSSLQSGAIRAGLNSSDPFKRAAANRQVSQQLERDKINAGIYKANLAANLSRANTIDDNNTDLAKESMNRPEVGALSLAQANKDRTADLAERKYSYSKNKDLNKGIIDAVNLTVPTLAGSELAPPDARFQALQQTLSRVKGKVKAPKSAIYQIDPDIKDVFESGANKDQLQTYLMEKGNLGLGTIHYLTESLY